MEQVAGTLPAVLFILVVNALSVLRLSHLVVRLKAHGLEKHCYGTRLVEMEGKETLSNRGELARYVN